MPLFTLGGLVSAFFLGIFAVSLLFSFVLTRYVRDLATVRGWVSVPGSDRHLHVRPLPRLGGVAIFLAFLLSIAVAFSLSRFYPSLGLGLSYRTLWSTLLPGCLVFFLGVYDDVHPLSPYVKFAGQALAGALLFAFGLRILDLPVLFGHHHFSLFISLPLTILWVLAITNAFNLIDGLDGLAAGSALFSTLVVFVVSLFGNSPWVSMMTLALAGAILGFLRYNFNPATIFLGDCGSLFIGFMLSALALRGAQKAPTTVAVAIPVVRSPLPFVGNAFPVSLSSKHSCLRYKVVASLTRLIPLSMPKRWKRRLKCALTVRRAIFSCEAISRLSQPCNSNSAICCSRGPKRTGFSSMSTLPQG